MLDVNEDGQGLQRMEGGSIYLALLDMFMPGKEDLETITKSCRLPPASGSLPCQADDRVACMMNESVRWPAGLLGGLASRGQSVVAL